MCGLAGVILPRTPRTPRRHAAVWSAFTDLLLCAQRRGTDAAGVAIIHEDGGFEVLKRPVRAEELVGLPEFEEMGAGLCDDVVAILGHARRITKGAKSNPGNNHPIIIEPRAGVHGGVIGIHNGTIRNDDSLFEKYGYPRGADVDSEIIFHLMLQAWRLRKVRAEVIRMRIAELQGSYSLVFCVLDEPRRVHVFRGSEPLCRHYEDDAQALFFASLPSYMEEVFGPCADTAMFGPGHAYSFDTSAPERFLTPECFAIPRACDAMADLTFDDLARIASESEFARRIPEQ